MAIQKFKTLKQRQLAVRKRHLVDFRRYVALKGNGATVGDYLDMNAFELREYFESQWLPDMDWENYGEYWVVDHVVALKYFDVFDRKDMKLCWSYNNLKPSYIWDNHAKGYCVEVTENILKGLPQNATVKLLLEKIADKVDMFVPYY